MAAHQAPPSLGFSRQEHWSGLPFPSPMHESEKWKWSRSVVSDSSHGLQPTRLLRPWDSPGKSTGVGCHCLLRALNECKIVCLPWETRLKCRLLDPTPQNNWQNLWLVLTVSASFSASVVLQLYILYNMYSILMNVKININIFILYINI